MSTEIEIARLGAQGDGIAEADGGSRYVAFALPGERFRLSDEGQPALVPPPSRDRATPLCRHFGTCGGCVAQHMNGRLYAEWKRGIVVDAFRQHGLQPDIAPLRRISPGTRRRAVLTARGDAGDTTRLGYHRRKSTELVDIRECPILAPEIVGRLSALRAAAAAVPGRDTRITVLATRGGLDLAITSDTHRLGPKAVAALAGIAAESGIARIAVNGDVVILRSTPVLPLAGVDALPPPGAFVQAAEAAEQEIARLVVGAVGKSRRVTDLFCGLGTFTFAIARCSRVLAVDGDRAAIAALGEAALRAQGLKPIETKVRDLFREPLSVKELKGFDAVVFDPPRAGAKAQAEHLARSEVAVAVAVSCDPGTLARDVRMLVDGGYRIESVSPVDQFLFSAHVEAVAVLRRR